MVSYDTHQTYTTVTWSNKQVYITQDHSGEYPDLVVELVGLNFDALYEIRDVIFEWVDANKDRFPLEVEEEEEE